MCVIAQIDQILFSLDIAVALVAGIAGRTSLKCIVRRAIAREKRGIDQQVRANLISLLCGEESLLAVMSCAAASSL